jgi:serine/threonine protein kinase
VVTANLTRNQTGTERTLFKARQKLGKYTILGRIASGPLANVYRAFDTIHKSRVALKIPKPARNISNADFLREVQVATSLVHPNILAVTKRGPSLCPRLR